ncbi:MAG: AAA family ATPase [Solibacillus sp.]
MIPYRLAFSGVRDFPATQLTFGDDFEHVLITGPNGTGKSTLAFCFGAVLNSSRVSLEGIRSNNIPDTQAWRASITLTFKNTGSSQVDGPPYIAFRVNIDQPSVNSIPQREYEILYGETLEDLVLEDIFRSGDSQQRNFSLYTEQLKKKYKIFPDMYYLIWYQQEVNQFAAYSPEERFRRFSDMYGISDIQQKWVTKLLQQI